MNQTYSSADTSINSTRLPAVYSKINFLNAQDIVLDYGCGKFNNAKEFVEKEFDAMWHGYDPFNRSIAENTAALACNPTYIICSNVLNTIDSVEEIQRIANYIRSYKVPYFITIYEGNKSGKGRATKKDCYQRNESVLAYLKYFPDAIIKYGVITNASWLLDRKKLSA